MHECKRIAVVSLAIAAVLLAACQPVPEPTEALSAQAAVVSTPTGVPTANLLPSETPTLPQTNTLTPTKTWTRTATATLTPTLTPSLTPSDTPLPTLPPTNTRAPTMTIAPSNTPISSPTPVTPSGDANATGAPTWTPPPLDPSVQIQDHYYMNRPISDADVNYVARTYPYGNTAGGRLQVHHGVDLVNPTGVEVLAAADGVVVYAGDDLGTVFGAYNNYYGNLVVIQHNFLDSSGAPVFSLYGHLSRIDVQVGQIVRAGDRIGSVGATGIAQGPHLHFEVRVGSPYDFGATRNPELWIHPYQTFGTLAGQVTDSAGNLLYDTTLTVESDEITRYAFSYADNSVSGDSTFGENYVLGDLPAGYYTVTVSDNGRIRFREIVYVYPNRTTWLNVRLN